MCNKDESTTNFDEFEWIEVECPLADAKAAFMHRGTNSEGRCHSLSINESQFLHRSLLNRHFSSKSGK